MQFAISELVRAARVYKDDDHDDEDAWLDDADWLRLFNVEYALLYPRWVRSNIVTPQYTDTPLTATTTALTGVMAIAGVAKLEDGRYTPLPHLQASLGRTPWVGSNPGQATGWLAYGSGDNLTIELNPPPSDIASATYVVRYIPRTNYFTSLAQTVELPYGADERLVLGMADRAGIKDSTVSRKVMEKMADADAALAFLGNSRGDGARVRRLSRAPHNDRFAAPFASDPRYFYFC